MLNIRSWTYLFAILGFLIPTEATGQEAPRCFRVVAVGGESTFLSRLRADTLILTKDPYSRGIQDVVWWQAFLASADPRMSTEPEAIPWRPIEGDSIEVQLSLSHVPAQLRVQDDGSALRGYVRVVSDEVGMPDARYDFAAGKIPCEESDGPRPAPMSKDKRSGEASPTAPSDRFRPIAR